MTVVRITLFEYLRIVYLFGGLYAERSMGEHFSPQSDLPGSIRGFRGNPRQVGISAASRDVLPQVNFNIAFQKPSPLPNTDQVVSSMIIVLQGHSFTEFHISRSHTLRF